MTAEWIEGSILVLTIILAAMAAAAETALTALSPVAVHTLEERGGVGRIIAKLRNDPNRFLSTILIVNSTSLIIASSMATLLFTQLWPSPWGELAATLGISLLVLIIAELTPKNIAVRKPSGVAIILARPVRLFSILLAPIITVVNAIVVALMRLLGQPGGAQAVAMVTYEDISSTISLAEETKGITEEEAERLEGVIDLGTITAGDVMKPRVHITAVEQTMPLMDALDVVLREGHSRIPVYDETIDRIVGILYDKDLLKYMRENEYDVALADMARPPIFVPESKRASDLLQQFQKEKIHIAIVVDEFGGTAGLVTIEDLLEEIVGEIQDEYDEEEELVVKENDRQWVFDAMVRVEEVNEEMGINLVADDGIETLGGFVFARLGELPEVGDVVEVDHVSLEVIEIEERRIKKVRITRLPGADEGLDEAEE
ncbi:MAG TPA: hemolysin family protein [Chloroflexota bacterium]|nr:hemolysin family protein [Chloroflexota bacterium]